MRQAVVFDCSAESKNEMTSLKDAEYSGCLPVCRQNVQKCGTFNGMCHENSCITIHK